MRSSSRWVRATLAGLAGSVAWVVGMVVFFGPAQGILSDPEIQSAKMLAAFGAGPAAPRSYAAPAVVILGIVAIGVVWGWVYGWIGADWPGPWWKRGLRFAAVGWALMVPWFEFYLPWNVLREPASLALLEAVLWALLLCGVGLAVAGVEAALRPRRGEAA